MSHPARRFPFELYAPMSTVLIAYATTEGHTGRIAERIAQTLRRRGHAVETCRTTNRRTPLQPASYDGVIVGASIHYGRHPRHLRSLVRVHRRALQARPSAFFSVSLSAGGPGAKPDAARRYLESFLHQTGWNPEPTATFAGALAYSKYGPFKRLLMVTFVGLAGGDTDTSRDYEYTDWGDVERFAHAFALRLSTSPGPT